MTIRRAEANSNVRQINDLPIDHRAVAGDSNRHLLHRNQMDPSPDNFCLMLVHVAKKYVAPRHRHNFDQVRVILDGRFGFGPGRSQEVGSVGYFGEGTYYTQDGDGPSTTLLLQVSGASGNGYMSERQMRAGVEDVSARGQFEDGVFSWRDQAGTKHNKDGYEAVWEHVFKRPLVYPKPRYDGPVLFIPTNFGWVADAKTAGVWVKHLGRFHERELGLSALRVEPGIATAVAADDRRTLLYVQAGAAWAPDGDLSIRSGNAVEILPGEALRLTAGDKGLETLRFSLPSNSRHG